MRDTRTDIIVLIIMICIMLISYLYYAFMIIGLVMLIANWISPPKKEEFIMYDPLKDPKFIKRLDSMNRLNEQLQSGQKSKNNSATQEKKAPIEKEIKPNTPKAPPKPGWRKRDLGIKPRENERKVK